MSPQTGNSRHKKHCIDRLTLGDVNKDSAVKTKAKDKDKDNTSSKSTRTGDRI